MQLSEFEIFIFKRQHALDVFFENATKMVSITLLNTKKEAQTLR